MTEAYFEILRPGINTTIQDFGRNHLYHIGIPFSGAMDIRNFYLANKLVNNILNAPIIEERQNQRNLLTPVKKKDELITER